MTRLWWYEGKQISTLCCEMTNLKHVGIQQTELVTRLCLWILLYFIAAKPASKTRNRRSSSHCCVALSLVPRNVAHVLEGFSAPATQPPRVRLNSSCEAHNDSPARKLCSRPVRAIVFRSLYPSPWSSTALSYSFVMSMRETPSSSVESATGTCAAR